jgi:hypothetical protein
MDAAIAQIDEGLALAQRTGEHVTDAWLYRLRGDLLLKRHPIQVGPAEEVYEAAIEVSHHQSASTFNLLACLSLAKLYQSTARFAEAHEALAPALEGFTPTPEMPDYVLSRPTGNNRADSPALREVSRERSNGADRRIADVADPRLLCLNWAESGPECVRKPPSHC